MRFLERINAWFERSWYFTRMRLWHYWYVLKYRVLDSWDNTYRWRHPVKYGIARGYLSGYNRGWEEALELIAATSLEIAENDPAIEQLESIEDHFGEFEWDFQQSR